MSVEDFDGTAVSRLGFGLMRLPKNIENPTDIDYDTSEKLVDHAIKSGVNYFDTAYTYVGSEEFAGFALSKYQRDSYYLATKCPPWMVNDLADFERIFAEQQRRCKTGYFDYYLIHNLAQEEKRAAGNEEYFKEFERIGMYDMLRRKKEEGLINRIGFSFHGTLELFRKLVDRYKWDFAYVQLNYIDWTATDAQTQYELLTSHGIPVNVMEPLRGGTLATLSDDAAKILKRFKPDDSLASWGIRYAASLPNVATIMSGMNSMEQLEDNISTLRNFTPITDHEKELLDEAAAVYNRSGAIACTACGYCLPCPREVNIPRIFSVYNLALLRGYRIPFDNGYSTLGENEKASNCNGCGHCTKNCPQHLSIPGYMREIDEYASRTT